MPLNDAYIDDYLGSEHLLFLDSGIKEPADGILRAFFRHAAARGADSLETLNASTVEAVLMQDLGCLDLPLPVRAGIPELLEGFFGYLGETGRFPAAGGWRMCAETLADRFRSALRDGGGVKGETYRKASAEVGRNDPCFCGSGKKFKKCCGPMMGA